MFRYPSSSAPAPPAVYDAGVSHPPVISSSSLYSSSLPSYCLHRSNSTHSLSLHHGIPELSNQQPFFSSSQHQQHQPPPPQPWSSPSSSSGDYLDFNAGPFRRVLSTGDLPVTKGATFSFSYPSLKI